MNKIILSLLSTPMLISSILSMTAMVNQVQAAEPVVKNTEDRLSCIRNKHKVGLVCARASVLAQIPTEQAEVEFSNDNVPMLEFSDQESEMAVTLFGCDCPACINSLRQMSGARPLVY
ncbi:hypothetical protein H6G80_28340 [Nostoc sp. FACHB-87]|uniref:hypothetical protein n=1 Tax=Nostocales TaxID=1161 RepID=UPI0016866850|nr:MULTISPECIES: hypothetical protein [Nostocales]MBD2297884.1 hypothetical protein [Nostoc sp. FACHB-190]MBD2457961.1 hypothetical protein [Nostoc sp. FACHB-87]MBD2479122.1 hypothetical protein [Anabaena sp. FACHB-83]MBD2489792.1 hypothetical protein [Aulosira sp. FACHB-615]